MLTPRTTRTANFNPRSREGSDMPLCFCSLLLQHFNPRSREGSDIQGNRHEPSLHYFNPRSREGSDCDGFYAMNTGMLFQSTLPRRERHRNVLYLCVQHTFQSTLPRRERRIISTARLRQRNFNPRSREGSDAHSPRSWKRCRNFNPRSREGSDTYPPAHRTHPRDFNPRSREGSDATEEYRVAQGKLFQSTLPRRERRMGGRSHLLSRQISIHAPAKGATVCVGFAVLLSLEFQSTLPRRERRRIFCRQCVSIYFNPRSREGSDTHQPCGPAPE